MLPYEIDKDIRKAYKGGYTYLNPKKRNKRLKGVVFDKNSMYPWVMKVKDLPYGYPIFYEGEYDPDDFYPLYIQRIRCSFKVKKDHLPTIQLKGNHGYIQTEYLTTSDGKIEEMTLTNVDLALFLEHYDVLNLEYVCGWKFKKCTGVFDEYIDFWYEVKATSKGAMRTIAKLMLNSLYGKFATNPVCAKKIPYLENGVVKYEISEDEFRDPVYTPMGAFITAWARDAEIRTAQAVYDRFIYGDTDSIHIEGFDLPTNIEIDPKKLGAWKHESTFTDSKFLRAKTYLETIDGVLHVTCAGMPDNVKAAVTYDNFTYGASFSGKLQPRRFKGGVVLIDTEFTIQKTG